MHWKTPEEAIEAWNCWKGRYKGPTPKLFRDGNPCNECSGIMKDNKFHEPLQDELVRPVIMLDNGSFRSPWPFLTPRQGQRTGDEELLPYTDMEVFKIRARWCALFPSVIEYRNTISNIIRYNDRDNNLLNSTTSRWNNRLDELGLPIFNDNDMRGVNLGGLELSGEPFDGAWLRNIDLRFAELSSVELDGVNLYGSDLRATHGIYSSLINSILAGVKFTQSTFSHARFELSDLVGCVFDDSLCYSVQFDGAKLSNASFCGAMLCESSFKSVVREDKGFHKDILCELDNIKWNDATDVRCVKIAPGIASSGNDFLSYINKANKNDIYVPWYKKIYNAILLKPNMFGVGLDVKALFKNEKD